MNQSKQKGFTWLVLLVVLGLAAMATGLWLGNRLHSASAGAPTIEGGTAIVPPRALADFTLVDHHGEAFSRADLTGDWTLMFFGYTHCPDVCPSTMAVLRSIVQLDREDGGTNQPMQVVMVSVDPDRDTPEQLKQYVEYFNPDFIGLTGRHAELRRLTKDVGVLYFANPADEETGDYTMDHTAALLLINPRAELTAVFTQMPHDPATIARDAATLRDHHRG